MVGDGGVLALTYVISQIKICNRITRMKRCVSLWDSSCQTAATKRNDANFESLGDCLSSNNAASRASVELRQIRALVTVILWWGRGCLWWA